MVHVRARNLILGACIIYLFIYLFKLRVHLVCLITSQFCFALFSSLICVVRDCAHTVGGSS